MPTSAIARMASGCTRVASVPALATSKRSPASERSSPSAIWLRAELWVHRNSTRCLFTSHLPCSLDRTSRSRAQCRPATEVVVAVTTTQQFTLARRVTAESVGTALLLAAVVGSGMMGERLAGGNVAVALLANTLATGAALVALILTFGPISGAHFNPAVTLADAWQGGRPWGEVPAYVGAQVVGAFVGVAAAHVMFEAPLFFASRHARAGGAQMFSEFVATFGLLAVIWGCARLPADAETIAAIYNEGIAERIATFETEPRTAAEIATLLASKQDRYPTVVVERDGRIVGWAGASAYRSRPAYAGVAEHSVYVARAARGTGVGREALDALCRVYAERGFWKLVSRIFTENKASLVLHERCGFRVVGVYRRHGQLEGRWRDCVIVEKLL